MEDTHTFTESQNVLTIILKCHFIHFILVFKYPPTIIGSARYDRRNVLMKTNEVLCELSVNLCGERKMHSSIYCTLYLLLR